MNIGEFLGDCGGEDSALQKVVHTGWSIPNFGVLLG